MDDLRLGCRDKGFGVLGEWEDGRRLASRGFEANRQTLRCLILMGTGVGTSVLEYWPPERYRGWSRSWNRL